MKNTKLISVTELNDERYVEIDSVVNDELVHQYLNAVEQLQLNMMQHNISAPEMYRYLLTLMLNQC